MNSDGGFGSFLNVRPGMGGGELAERGATAWPRTKLLFTSGFRRVGYRVLSGCADSPHFIGKPFTVYRLTNKVREVLGLA